MPVERAYWTLPEFVAYSGMAKKTVYNRVSLRTIPHTKRDGKLRFHIERTKAWLDKGEVQPKRKTA